MALTRTILTQTIKMSADSLGGMAPRGFQTGQITKERAEAILAQCSMCLTHLAAALNAGMEAEDTVTVTLYGQKEPQEMTLTQVQDWCLEIGTMAGERVYRSRIQQALLQAHVWVHELQEPGALNQDQALLAAETGNYLLQVLRDAQAAGVSDQMLLELNDAPMTLSEVRALGEYVETTGHQLKEALDAERAAKDLPYLQLLTGDKLRLFKEECAGLSGLFAVWGSGGTLLDTPEKMRDAVAWYVWGCDTTLPLDVWRVRGWRFEGDRKTEHHSAQGIGTRPPETAFP